ncbi:epoxide hydrolase-like protein, partial [Calycina marina]
FQGILDYELSHGIPPGWVNNCISKTKPFGYWHRLERGEMLMDETWFRGFSSDLQSKELWEVFYATARVRDSTLPSKTPAVPNIDGEELFWMMMDISRASDPWVFPALQKLKASRKYILAALSNTMIYPPGHPYTTAHSEVREIFDLFISSAHVGMRKPDPPIYNYAIRALNEYSLSHGGSSIAASDILFLDDIGENLKTARNVGFNTIKVNLGRAFDAVDQLEDITGLKLAGNHPRVPIVSQAMKEAAKL